MENEDLKNLTVKEFIDTIHYDEFDEFVDDAETCGDIDNNSLTKDYLYSYICEHENYKKWAWDLGLKYGKRLWFLFDDKFKKLNEFDEWYFEDYYFSNDGRDFIADVLYERLKHGFYR